MKKIEKKIVLKYIEKKFSKMPNSMLKKIVTNNLLNKNSLNEVLEYLYLEKIEKVNDLNIRNGVFIPYIKPIGKETKEITYSFRARDIIIYDIQNKQITINQNEYKMCGFLKEDYKTMIYFINNCLLDKQGVAVQLESYEIF